MSSGVEGAGGSLAPRDPDSQDVSVLPPGAQWLQLQAPRPLEHQGAVRARMLGSGLRAHAGGRRRLNTQVRAESEDNRWVHPALEKAGHVRGSPRPPSPGLHGRSPEDKGAEVQWDRRACAREPAPGPKPRGGRGPCLWTVRTGRRRGAPPLAVPQPGLSFYCDRRSFQECLPSTVTATACFSRGPGRQPPLLEATGRTHGGELGLAQA